MRLLKLLAFSLFFCCGDPPEMFAYRHEVRLPEGYRHQKIELPFKEVVITSRGNVTVKGDSDEQVLITADTRTKFEYVQNAIRQHASGGELWVSVGLKRKEQTMRLHDSVGDNFFFGRADESGRLCVWPPEAKQQACKKAGYTNRVERNTILTLVGKAAAKYNATGMRVSVSKEMTWGNVVRIVDASRTKHVNVQIMGLR